MTKKNQYSLGLPFHNTLKEGVKKKAEKRFRDNYYSRPAYKIMRDLEDYIAKKKEVLNNEG